MMKMSIQTILPVILSCLMLGLMGCGNVEPARTAMMQGASPSEEMSGVWLDVAMEQDSQPEPKVREPHHVPKLEVDLEELEVDLNEKMQPVEGFFETTLTAEESEGTLDIRFSTKNISGKALRVSHGSGQLYDIWVYNDQGEEVYRWSYNRAFTQALIVRGLGASESLSFEEAWSLQDANGEPVPAGVYTVAVEVMIDLEEGAIDREQLKAQSTVELTLRP